MGMKNPGIEVVVFSLVVFVDDGGVVVVVVVEIFHYDILKYRNL